MISKAMIMAAGLGTRLRPFTDLTPKALLPVMGLPAAGYVINSLAASGVSKIIANVHHHAAQARVALQGLSRPGCDILISDESAELLGSAGGIRKAWGDLGEPFFRANADVITDLDWQELEKCHVALRERRGVRLTLAVFPAGPEGEKYREIQWDHSTGLIQGLGKLVEGHPFFMGAAVLEPECMETVPLEGASDFVLDILKPAIRDQKAGVFFSSGTWHDVGNPYTWWRTHLDLLDRLERGDFRTRISHGWQRELLRTNRRIKNGIWLGLDTSKEIERAAENWIAPCYWNSWGDAQLTSPRVLGPRAVIYGKRGEDKSLVDGISYCGLNSNFKLISE